MADAVGLWVIVYFCVTSVNTKDCLYMSIVRSYCLYVSIIRSYCLHKSMVQL